MTVVMLNLICYSSFIVSRRESERGVNAGQSGESGREWGGGGGKRRTGVSGEWLRRHWRRRDHEGGRPHPWRLLRPLRLEGRSCRRGGGASAAAGRRTDKQLQRSRRFRRVLPGGAV